nr:PREDICTED: uncharacterized protein LOC105662976 [Megachile rotundata]
MNKPRDNNETGISKRWQSSQTEATLLNQNTRQSGTIHEYEGDRLGTEVKKSCDKSCTKKVKSPTRSGCSRYCTGIKQDVDESFETVCTSRKRNKLGYRMKRSKKKLQEISDHVKKRTKLSMKRIKKMYENLNVRRAAGFTCDLKKCESTLFDCSTNECAKPNMLFNTVHKLRDKFTRDKEDIRHTVCHSKSSRVGTKNDLKVLKEQSTETNVEEETSM